jgi:hypothetical protein
VNFDAFMPNLLVQPRKITAKNSNSKWSKFQVAEHYRRKSLPNQSPPNSQSSNLNRKHRPLRQGGACRTLTLLVKERLRRFMLSILRRRSGITAVMVSVNFWGMGLSPIDKLVSATKPSHQETIPNNINPTPALAGSFNPP